MATANINGHALPERQATKSQTSPAPEPIAIVGMGCRLPGDVHSPSDLWQMLKERRTGQGVTPSSRWNADGFYHPDPDYPGTLHHRGGYFLSDDPRHFDNTFFGINNLEATAMDPQQRNLLEVTFQCLENAGIRLEDLSGADVGTYVGNFTIDSVIMTTKDPDTLSRHNATGIGSTVLANRISHCLNLSGPSCVFDTACSSSLYALHYACLALQANEISGAIVAGTNLLMTPEQHIATTKAGVLSPTSTCHTFDESADGYGRADGIGVLYVKRLSDAIRDNDPIQSIVRGCALNCNGRTFGITSPSTDAQEDVIRKAYRKAMLSPEHTEYVECHGTGTAVGDPIEIEALSRVFSSVRHRPLLLGAVKTNVGHSEAACAIAGIIKSVLILKNKAIPPSYGVKKLNPRIKSDEWNVHVVTENQDWPDTSTEYPRRVGVNSFGYGGANAHAILEDVGNPVPLVNGNIEIMSIPDTHSIILPISASNGDALRDRIDCFKNASISSADFLDLVYTLGSRRTHMRSRAYMITDKSKFAGDIELGNWIRLDENDVPASLPLAFAFTGQGAQWPQMGLELIEKSPTFRSTIRSLDLDLRNLLNPPAWTLQEIISEPSATSTISEADKSQPVCTAIQIALVDLLRTWGICPQVAVGHSSGEIAAAYAAGYLSKFEAMAIAYYRGFVVSRSTYKGAMMAVAMSEEEANYEITAANLNECIRVACVNSPESTTISGLESAIDTLCDSFKARKIFARKLRTNGKAYHSFEMANCGTEYEDLLRTAMEKSEQCTNAMNGVQMFSSVTKEEITGQDVRSPSYWRRNLESPVRFSEAVSQCWQDGSYQFVELGPHSALELPLRQIHKASKDNAKLNYTSALVRNKSSLDTTLTAVGQLWVNGFDVDFGQVNATASGSELASDLWAGAKVLTDLPTYPWQHNKALWNESHIDTEYRSRAHPHHSILGTTLPTGNKRLSLWRNLLRTKEASWLIDHRLNDTIIFPAAAYITMAVHAIAQVQGLKSLGEKLVRLKAFRVLNPLTISDVDTEVFEVFTELHHSKTSQSRQSKRWYRFEISSRSGDSMVSHASGTIRTEDTIEHLHQAAKFDVFQNSESLEPAPVHRWFEQLRKNGLNLGPRFRKVQRLQVDRTRTSPIAIGEFEDLNDSDPQLMVHPTTVDTLLQLGLIANAAGDLSSLRVGLPVSIEEFSMRLPSSYNPVEPLKVLAVAKTIGFGNVSFDIKLATNNNEPVAVFSGCRCVQYSPQRSRDNMEAPPILELQWKPDMTHEPTQALAKHLDTHVNNIRGKLVSDSSTVLNSDEWSVIGILDLISYKQPLRQISTFKKSGAQFNEAISTVFGLETTIPRCESYGEIDSDGQYHELVNCMPTNDTEEGDRSQMITGYDSIDVLICTEATTDELLSLRKILKALSSNQGWLICKGEELKSLALSSGFKTLFPAISDENSFSSKGSLLVFRGQSTVEPPMQPFKHVVHIDHDCAHSKLATALRTTKHCQGAHIEALTLDDVHKQGVPKDSLVVFSLDMVTDSVLASMTEDTMKGLQTVFESAGYVVWVTDSETRSPSKSELGLAMGFFRTMRLEYSSTKFAVMDVDNLSSSSQEQITRALDCVMAEMLKQNPSGDDEWLLRNGVLHISRLESDTQRSRTYECKTMQQAVRTELKDMRNSIQLDIKQAGNFSTLTWQEHLGAAQELQENEVEVEVKAVGMNAKDVFALAGRIDTKGSTSSIESTGIVRRVGANVTRVQLADRVVVMAPQKYASIIRVPDWCCSQLQPHEDFAAMATIALVCSSAIYALRHRAHLAPGESILIHSATGGLGQAAIQLARNIGAEIFVTAGTERKRQYLRDEYGIAMDHIFSSRDEGFLQKIMQKTSGHGVDVVLNFLTGDLLHTSWQCCAEFGRFIEVGKTDIQDHGNLDMSVFERGASFSAFDLTDLHDSKNPRMNQTWSKLLDETLTEVRAGRVQLISPMKVFSASEVVEAFSYFRQRDRLGKVVVSFEDVTCPLKVQPLRYESRMSPHKFYLMIGCLGGLGRALSRWMMDRGARRFIFIGRSGTDRPSAQLLVDDLKKAACEVQVIRGDVSSESAVEAAFEAATAPVGGVVHAAMNLDESLFSQMTLQQWQSGLAPKTLGATNLHKCLTKNGRAQSLDFFVMTSSIAGSFGQATESSYTAGNAFLDYYATQCRDSGLPATSIGLGAIKDVGYLAENPEAGEILHRQGLTALTEDEVLQFIDIAISGSRSTESSNATHQPPSRSSAHFITGLQNQTPERHLRHFIQNPRACFIAANVSRQASAAGEGSGAGRGDQEIPETVTVALKRNDKKGLRAAVKDVVQERLAKLLRMSVERVQEHTKLLDLGMDSMLAVEIRQACTMGRDIPVAELMTPDATVGDLVARVVLAWTFLGGHHHVVASYFGLSPTYIFCPLA